MIVTLLKQLFTQHGLEPILASIISVCVVLVVVALISWISYYIARHFLVRSIRFVISRLKPQWSKCLIQHRVFQRLSLLAPALIIYYAAPLISSTSLSFTHTLATLLESLSAVAMLLTLTISINGFLNAVDDIYNQFSIAKHRPIKSYLQVAKIILYGISAILIIATLLDRSPSTLLTGLGALTAILLLIFKDSILGFVASVQLATYDMVRIGDWIEMPKYGVDGDVIDISLNTIKVQNFDKTIVTVPSYALLNEGVKNWRGMSESGGRRIKRAIFINMNSIQFCTQEMLERFCRIKYVADYVQDKLKEMETHNSQLGVDLSLLINGRHLTNIGVFRAYLQAYLSHHPHVHQNLTFLIRQLKPTEKGLPIEIYIFTNDTNWNRYEAIQADIFDHILAIIPYFDLRAFQDISSLNVAQLPQTQTTPIEALNDERESVIAPVSEQTTKEH